MLYLHTYKINIQKKNGQTKQFSTFFMVSPGNNILDRPGLRKSSF